MQASIVQKHFLFCEGPLSLVLCSGNRLWPQFFAFWCFQLAAFSSTVSRYPKDREKAGSPLPRSFSVALPPPKPSHDLWCHDQSASVVTDGSWEERGFSIWARTGNLVFICNSFHLNSVLHCVGRNLKHHRFKSSHFINVNRNIIQN